MDFFTGLLQGLGKFIKSDLERNDHYEHRNGTLHVTVNMMDEDEEQQEEEDLALMDEGQPRAPILLDEEGFDESQIIYATDEEANKAFVSAYILYMHNHYGRAPRYRTDLYCAMFPVDILDRRVDDSHTERYWWFAVTHPAARVLRNNFKEYSDHGSQGVYDSKLYGACVIYADDVMDIFIDWMVDMCAQCGFVFEDVRSAYAQKRVSEEQEEEAPLPLNDIVYDLNGELVNGAAPSPPSSLPSSLPAENEGDDGMVPINLGGGGGKEEAKDRPSVIQQLISRPEGSKKRE